MAATSSILTPPLSPKSTHAGIHRDNHHQQHNSNNNNNNSNQEENIMHSYDAFSTSGEATPTASMILPPQQKEPQQQQQQQQQPLTQILVLYHKATSTFLLRQLALAYSTSLEALELLTRTNLDYGLDQAENLSTRRSFFVLKQKLWVLHATIFGAMLTDRVEGTTVAAASGNGGIGAVLGRFTKSGKESPEKLVKDLWKRLVEDYGGLEGDVDGQVMVPFTLLCINQKLYTLARQITEAYLATIPEGMLIHLETAAGALTTSDSVTKDPLMTNYERLVELYLIHVLAKLSEWDYARQFIDYNSVLSDGSKKVYLKILDKLHQKSLRPPKKVIPAKAVNTSKASSSVSSSGASTTMNSPTMSSASSMGSPAMGHSQDNLDQQQHVKGASSSLSSLTGTHSNGATTTTTKTTKGSSSSSSSSSSRGSATANGKGALTKSKAKAGNGTTLSSAATTAQGRFMILLQHYVDLIRTASQKMGTNELMVIVGLVVFLGTLSRHRVRASRVIKAGVAKLMQTVKMGTTVTSI